MGQRARRQLAEKQFGTGARHLSLSGLPAGGGPPAAAQLSHAARQRPGVSGMTGPGNVVTAAEQALHPSWEAKRQQRASLIVPPEGKKVIFGDDGVPALVAPAPAANRELPAGDPAERRGEKRGGMSRNGVQSAEGDVRVAHGNGRRLSATYSSAGKSAQAPPNGTSSERLVKGGVRFRSEGALLAEPSTVARKATGSATGLHPSWAAKKLLRQQMERLPAPQGAKVVFQDSD
jgi:hypothetical protein